MKRCQYPPFISTGDPNSFAMKTIKKRMPLILNQVVKFNPVSGISLKRLQNLKEELNHGVITDPFKYEPLNRDLFEEEELASWKNILKQYKGKFWDNIPWYVAESLFYLKLLIAFGYYDPDSIFYLKDPFQPLKDRELYSQNGGLALVHQIIPVVKREVKLQESLEILIHFSLWGNRIDLSNYNIAHQEKDNVLLLDKNKLLIDHTSLIVNLLLNSHRVDIILDNSGTELVCDLMLVKFLLSFTSINEIHLYLKKAPMFVSDAMIKDIVSIIKALSANSKQEVSSLGMSINSLLGEKKIILKDHFFWNGPLHFPDFPNSIKDNLSNSDLVIIKGDANYRRLLSDRKWDPWRSMEKITAYFPAPFATLRTLKSEIIVDIPQNRVEQLFREDPEWLINGKRGIIRLVC